MFDKAYTLGYKYGLTLTEHCYGTIDSNSPYHDSKYKHMRFREGVLNGFLDRLPGPNPYDSGFNVGKKYINCDVLDIESNLELLNPYSQLSEKINYKDWGRGFIDGSHMEQHTG